MVLRPEGFDWDKYITTHDRLSIPYQIWIEKKMLERMPHLSDDSFSPPRRYDDPAFMDSPTGKIDNAIMEK